jgi:exodeoxyribonuclease-3
MITPGLRRRVSGAAIYRDERFSDHAPQIMEFDWDIEP